VNHLLRWLVLVSLVVISTALGETQQIHLRIGSIPTPSKPTGVRLASLGPGAGRESGLYLLQLTNHVEAGWREELRGLGVELLHFVPDHAFVAQFRDVPLQKVESLPFVHWVGPYLAAYKLHPRVSAQLATNVVAGIDVKLLIEKGATPIELLQISRMLSGSVQTHRLGFGTVFTGRINAHQLRILAESPKVLWIEPAPRIKMTDEIAVKIIGGDTGTAGGLASVQKLGFDGRGVTVAVADSGLDSGDLTDLHPDLAGRVDALFFYGGLPDASDHHGHGTHVAGIVAANAATGEVDANGYLYGLGVAPGAHLVGERIFDGAGNYFPPPSNAKLTQDAVRSGAYVGSNSWGDDVGGEYNLNAAEFDALVRDADPDVPGEQPYVLEFSAGNAGPGPQTMDSPGVGKNVISTGASENNRFDFGIYADGQEAMADFSSRGPAEDGRIKPDIVAPGTWIASTRSVYANDNNDWSPIDDYYLYEGGTSQAGPHASGACAVAVQWYRSTHSGATPSPALVKGMLINSATPLGVINPPDPTADPGSDPITIPVADNSPVPNFDEGWGRIDLENLIISSRRYVFIDQAQELATGDVFEKRVVVGNGAQLRVTMVYTDVPGLPAAIPALVNDLDLELVAPDGRIYRGNAFADGESVASTPEGDRINNVEAVHISAPEAGEWVARVVAHSVSMDIHHRTNGAPVQDFTLVISGQLPAAGEGVVSWDREFYSSPALATVRYTDTKLTNVSSLNLRVTSTSDTNGFVLSLTPTNASGTFVGSLSLSSDPTQSSARRLQVSDGDSLFASYLATGLTNPITATATIDVVPPSISNVETSMEFGRVSISWDTSEPASATIYYGTTNALTNTVVDLGFRNTRSLDLPTLLPGTNYFYYVVSTDQAGNSTTNKNSGVYFRFIAPTPTSTLLIYTPEGYFAAGGVLSDTPYPGIENWTDALSAIGLDYEVWDTSVQGRAPNVSEINQYRLVLWRPEELQALVPGMTTVLSQYVSRGGAFFVASFDLISRLEESGATNFIRDVLHVGGYVVDQGANSLQGVSGDPVGGGSQITLDYSAFPSGLTIDLLGIDWTTGSDFLNPATNTASVFLQESQKVVGVRFPKTGLDSTAGRVVFDSFALEAVPSTGDAPNNRAAVLANAIRFLTPGLIGGASVALDQSAYTIPANLVIEVTDSGRLTNRFVQAALEASGSKIPISLSQTVNPGVFRGRITLVGTNVSRPDQFLVKNGDVLTAVYTDSSSNIISSLAVVDTVKPIITEVAADPAYNDASISWVTDKPSDATVRFGQTAGGDGFLSRTAFSAELATNHVLQINGLVPDRNYFFQVVSRDAAGNQVVDNNGGKLYVVRTLKPLTPPWNDNLESSPEGWVVYNDTSGGAALPGDITDPGSTDGPLPSSGWQHGVPAQTNIVTAHSGTNVWATNLNGDSVDYASSDLISPAVGLIGGNQAALHFWQFYDFPVSSGGSGDEGDDFGDITIETGQVALSADDGATWNDLYAIQSDSTTNWERVDIDISAYVGSVVRIRFNYQLFAFTASPRVGWLIDDIGVTMSVVASTSLVVSNNLSEASFSISGPTNVLQGEGVYFQTNLPAGTYSVTWAPVTYYRTPPPQTNQLADSTNALVFRGVYTFPDVNNNGISDLWEQYYFGSVALGYSGSQDSDGDGMSDWEEWQAGTNPRDSTSLLRLNSPLTLPNGTVRLEWSTVPGRRYWLETSNDLRTWVRVSDVTRATGNLVGVTLPALDPRLPYYFRARVEP